MKYARYQFQPASNVEEQATVLIIGFHSTRSCPIHLEGIISVLALDDIRFLFLTGKSSRNVLVSWFPGTKRLTCLFLHFSQQQNVAKDRWTVMTRELTYRIPGDILEPHLQLKNDSCNLVAFDPSALMVYLNLDGNTNIGLSWLEDQRMAEVMAS